MSKLRAAVVGVGHLGKFHAQKYDLLPEVELVALVDTDAARVAEFAQRYHCQACTAIDEIFGKVDLVSIAVPTVQHHALAKACLAAGIHVLVEKPITTTVKEASELIAIAKEKQLILQVGHSERFHPALQSLKEVLNKPIFIEAHRLAPFKPRGIDVDVVLDLMIHDIDIILNVVDSELVGIHPVGVPVVTDQIDIANARLEFANGAIANVTASRVSRDTLRKMRFFQKDTYITVDFFSHKISTYSKNYEALKSKGDFEMKLDERQFGKSDAILEEVRTFIQSVSHGVDTGVTGEEGGRALEVALEIGSQLRA